MLSAAWVPSKARVASGHARKMKQNLTFLVQAFLGGDLGIPAAVRSRQAFRTVGQKWVKNVNIGRIDPGDILEAPGF